MRVGNARLVEHCRSAIASSLGPKLFRRQEAPNQVAARREKSTGDEQQDHINRNPIGMKLKRREQNKDQPNKGKDRSAQIVGMPIISRATAHYNHNFGVSVLLNVADG